MRMNMIAAALGGVVLVAMSAVSSQAEPTNIVQITDASAAAALPCWTSFDPPNPNGGRMYQHYKNCNSASVAVTIGFVEGSGQVSVYPEYCTWVAPGSSVTWNVPYTFQGANYQSALCRSF